MKLINMSSDQALKQKFSTLQLECFHFLLDRGFFKHLFDLSNTYCTSMDLVACSSKRFNLSLH